ncbi:MAG: hypothetical protein AAF639_40275 [Chloroflexota bacterium]
MNTQINPTINTFSDLLSIVQNNHEWRQQLVTALFPDFDIQKTLEELVETNRLLREDIALVQARLDRVEDDIKVLKEDVKVLKEDVKVLKEDVKVLKEDMHEVKQSIGDLQVSVAQLKGNNYENEIINKVNSIFGRVLRRGRDGRNELSDHLDRAEEMGIITEKEGGDVLDADLLWQGIVKKSRQPIFLIGEASWLAEIHDVERAVARTRIVQKAGLDAVSIVAGQKWSQEALDIANQHNIVRIRNYTVDQVSWLASLPSPN